jgi:two-component system OmpR family response regulator/two-component system response regulator QseB
VGSVSQAWAALRTEVFDAVVLDLGLPDADGATLLRRLREAPRGTLPDPATPLLVATARDRVAARVHALDLGADDYLTKPFDAHELAARLRAVRRRAMGRAQALLTRAGLVVDPAARQVRHAGQAVELSGREFGVLLALLEASPRVLSRQHIETRIYTWAQAIGSNAIDVHIHHLRRKLGEDLIQTVRGVGYFIPEDTGP